MSNERTLTRWVTLAAALLSGGLAVAPPTAWFFFSKERVAGALEAETEVTSYLVAQVVSANPELWEYEQVRLGDYLSRRPRRGDPEVRRILNPRGEAVVESVDPLPRPWIRRTVPLLDAGAPVGTIEIVRSLRPPLIQAGFLALLLLVPAAVVFHVLRTLPLEALRRTEGELRRQRDAAQKYLDVAGVAFVIVDAEGRIQLMNRKGAEILARTDAEVLGRDWLATFVDPADRARLSSATAAARPDEVLNLEFTLLRPSGDRRIVAGYATPLADERGVRSGVLLSGVDITHQRQLEDQLRQAQKLRAVGQLAGGVAHDFNNILAAIRARAALLRSDLALGNPHRLDAEEILAAADRAAALTRSLLTFSRRQALATEPVDLVELVRRTERRLRRLLPEEIVLGAELPVQPLPVLADPVQIEQVLTQLVTNARDAIRGPGRIVVAVAPARLEADEARRLGLPAPGAYARVAVTDNGAGLDPEARARLFEPFFTTKEVGKGTGLGLAIAFGIIELHRGTIRVSSEPGRGTTLEFLLPVGAAEPRLAETGDPDAAESP